MPLLLMSCIALSFVFAICIASFQDTATKALRDATSVEAARETLTRLLKRKMQSEKQHLQNVPISNMTYHSPYAHGNDCFSFHL